MQTYEVRAANVEDVVCEIDADDTDEMTAGAEAEVASLCPSRTNTRHLISLSRACVLPSPLSPHPVADDPLNANST